MIIELLYFEGCPSWKNGLKNLQEALTEEQIQGDIRLMLIENDGRASEEKFLGSPSFRINGQDLWSEKRSSYHLNCRVYATDYGLHGTPTVEMLREKIRASTGQ